MSSAEVDVSPGGISDGEEEDSDSDAEDEQIEEKLRIFNIDMGSCLLS